MNEEIQDKLEKIDNHVRWLSERLDRYFHALGEISSCGDQANAVYLRGVALAALDGEPTTADEFNPKWVSPHDPGDENDHVCKHNVPKNVQCPICAGSEDRWHDTNAQVVAYDKSMEEE
mgnify:CR=1 FL=1|jgi:hypothetical protein